MSTLFTIQDLTPILAQLAIGTKLKDQIINAVNSGNEVIIPKNSIDFNGWVGFGYIIIDPVTKSGAYMISGDLCGASIIASGLSAIDPWVYKNNYNRYTPDN